MYIEVEPGLIAVHTQPEDITNGYTSIFLKKVILSKNEELMALGYYYVRMLSTKAPKWTGGIYSILNPLIKMIHLKIQSVHSQSAFLKWFCFLNLS